MEKEILPFDEFIGQSFERAFEKLSRTHEYYMADERVHQMKETLQMRFSEEDFTLIEKYVDVALYREGALSYSLYQHAYKDCVYLLKRIHVL